MPDSWTKKKDFQLRILVVFVILLRLFGAQNRSAWTYADEWFQTGEFAHFLVNGSMGFVQEVALHLRNWVWPGVLTIPLAFAKLIRPDSVFLKTYAIQVFMVALDLGILWGWLQVCKGFLRENRIESKVLPLSVTFLILPWFTLSSSSSPSVEHAASILVWLALGCFARNWMGLAGFFSALCAVVKYPMGLFALGFFVVLLIRRKGLVQFLGGLMVGGALLGASDFYFYGRPWESLWMFLQYNVLTGAGSEVFGEQSYSVYLEYFAKHWGGPLLPLSLALFPAVLMGWFRGLRKFEFWSYGAAFYLVGHLLIRHKEPRFMEPLEWMVVWAGVSEWSIWYNTLRSEKIHEYFKERIGFKFFKFVLIFVFVVNTALLLRSFWGDRWSAQQTYFEVDQHLTSVPNVCAIVSVRKPLSLNLPNLNQQSFAYFPQQRRGDDFLNALSNKPLIWIENTAQCRPEQRVLIHLHKPSQIFESHKCNLLPSGILSWTPRSLWPWVLERNLASGIWYDCPQQALALFKKSETRHLLVKRFKKLDRLPSLHIPSESLKTMVYTEFPDHQDAVMPDW